MITSYYNCDSASDDESKSKKTIEHPQKSILKVKSKPQFPPAEVKDKETESILYGPQLPEEIEKAIFTNNGSNDRLAEQNPAVNIKVNCNNISLV